MGTKYTNGILIKLYYYIFNFKRSNNIVLKWTIGTSDGHIRIFEIRIIRNMSNM